MSYHDRQEAMKNIREGMKELYEKSKEADKDNVTTFSFKKDRQEMTAEEKDNHILALTDAVNQLTERLNKIDGGNE